MATVFKSTAYDLNTVFQYTYRQYRNRFSYRDRDVLKGVRIQEIKTYQQDRLNQPEIKYRITTYSYPQYKPYTDVKSRRAAKQRKIKHQYDTVLILESMDMSARFMWREGSQKKWPKYSDAPWSQIKTLHSTTRKKLERKYGKGTPEYKKAVKKHQAKAKYLDFGDWVSKEKGINGDFYWRNMNIAHKTGNLYGINWNEDGRKDGVLFFGKHTLRIILFLLKSKKISY